MKRLKDERINKINPTIEDIEHAFYKQKGLNELSYQELNELVLNDPLLHDKVIQISKKLNRGFPFNS